MYMYLEVIWSDYINRVVEYDALYDTLIWEYTVCFRGGQVPCHKKRTKVPFAWYPAVSHIKKNRSNTDLLAEVLMNDHSIIFDIIDFCIVFFGYCIQESTICRWKAKEKKMKEKEKEKATPVAVESNKISAFIFFPWKFHDNWNIRYSKNGGLEFRYLRNKKMVILEISPCFSFQVCVFVEPEIFPCIYFGVYGFTYGTGWFCWTCLLVDATSHLGARGISADGLQWRK